MNIVRNDQGNLVMVLIFKFKYRFVALSNPYSCAILEVSPDVRKKRGFYRFF